MDSLACLLLSASITIFLVMTNATASSPCNNCDGNNVTCVDGGCLPRCVNVTSSGECLLCRDSKFHGKQCQNVCPDTCLNSSCKMNKSHLVCTEGCVAGKKGHKCTVDCSSNCAQCERYGDRCIGECGSKLYYGDYCNKTCPAGCKDGCEKTTGQCHSCQSGYTGDYCNKTCPAGCKDGCEKTTGQCHSCQSSYTGDYCNKTCPAGCKDGCEKTTGQCHSCQSGYTGDYCNKTCPAGCKDGCEKITGQCHSCQSGYTGDYCNKTCPAGCKDGCEKITGQCHSCQSSYTGDYCNKTRPGCCKDPLMIAGMVLIAVVVTGSLILIAVMMWKRRRVKISEEIGPSSDLNSHDITTDDKFCDIISSSKCHINPTYGLAKDYELKFVSYCEELQTKYTNLNIDYILNEFTKLPLPDSRPAECGSHQENTHRNRYRDVLPFDETRVFLQTDGKEDHDYINASYVNGYRNLVRYVAAQGPSLQVIDDFWRMIWQLNATKIVMLTNLVEAGKVKCEMYWPFCSSEYQAFGKVCVQCVEEKVYQFYTLRTFAVWKGKANTRTVRQFHYTAWPDHGVPEETKSIIDFHRVVKDTGPNSLGPMVIHCSAGVGRSGTFIALDYLLDEARYEGSVCIYKCIQQFRFQRMKMVQTKEQYKFVYDVLASALQYRGTLPIYYSPVLVQCAKCSNKKKQVESPEDEASVEENNQEYQPLWNCGLENRESFLPGRPQPMDVCAIISEESPPLLGTPIQMQLEADIEVEDEMEKQRISWDTAL